MTDDLLVFLNARLDEDEAAAEAAGGSAPQGIWAQVDPERRPGRIDCDSGYVVTYDEGSPDDGQAAHIARHDPARALREVAAKRSILAVHIMIGDEYPDLADTSDARACGGCGLNIREDYRTPDIDDCPTLRAMASAWSDRAGYRPEWALGETVHPA